MALTSATKGNNINLFSINKMLREKLFPKQHQIIMNIKFSAVLRKPCWITGKSLTSTQNIFCFKRNLNLVQLKTDLVMYFTVNLAFVNYFDKMIETLGVPILRNWTTQEQILPISMQNQCKLIKHAKNIERFCTPV